MLSEKLQPEPQLGLSGGGSREAGQDQSGPPVPGGNELYRCLSLSPSVTFVARRLPLVIKIAKVLSFQLFIY